MIPSKRLLAFCCAALSGLACRDVTGPNSVPGTYVLTSINGLSLPAEISHTGGFIVDAIADTLVLGSDGKMSESGVGQVRGAGSSATMTLGAEGTYTVHGDTVIFQDRSGDALIPTIHYLASRRGLTLDHPAYRALYTKR